MNKLLLTSLLLSVTLFNAQANDYEKKQDQAVANIPLDLQEIKRIGYVVVEPGVSDNFRLVLLSGGEGAGYSQVYIQWLRMQEGWEAPQMIKSVPIKEINKDYNYFVTNHTCLNETCSKLRFETILGEYLHADNPKKTIFTLQLKPNGKYSIKKR